MMAKQDRPIVAHECDSCDWKGAAAALQPIKLYAERVTPGGVAPSGECPECGALAYPNPEDRAAALTLLRRVRKLADVKRRPQ